MRAITLMLLFLLLFYSQSGLAQSTTTFTTSATYCRTVYGPSSVASPPTTSASNNQRTTIVVTFIETPIRYYTPFTEATRTVRRFVTVTSTRIASTSPITSTFTTTITDRLVRAATTNTYVSVVSFVGQVRPSLTVTSAPSFTPILDTIPGSSPNKRSLPCAGRAQLEPRQNSASSYAQRVNCLAITRTAVVVVSTVTGSSRTVTLGTSTLTTTSISNIVTTSTIYQNPYVAITTITKQFTTTITPSATLSAYSFPTVTSTTLGPLFTYYPQCHPRINAAFKVNGYPVQGFEEYPPAASNAYQIEYFSPSKFAECCGACIESPTCAAAYVRIAPGGGGCQFISRTNGVCDAANPLLLRAVLYDSKDPAYDSTSLFNNKCGKFVGSRLSSDPQ